MRLKKVIVSEYIFKDVLGNFTFKDIAILVEENSPVTRQNFNQVEDEYYISSIEIAKMAAEVIKQKDYYFEHGNGD